MEMQARTTLLVEEELLGQREKLLAFLRKKVSDPIVAEDILQESLLKAVQAAPDLKDEDKLVPWFYRILNNAVIDHYRKKGTEGKYMDQYALEADTRVEPEDEAMICACFRELIPTLKPEYAELIEAMELGDEDSEVMAEHLGITRNNLKVRRYRARQQLRERVEEACHACCTGGEGYMDCTCSTGW